MVKENKFLSGIAILIGTIIGAGVLGIPYVVARAGLVLGIIYILLLGFIVLLINLYLGEVILRTKGKHHLQGYAEKYLGKKGKFFMNLAVIFVVYSAIIAYTLGIGESFSFLFFGNFDYSILIGLAFALFMSLLIAKGLKELRRFEKWGVGLILLLLIFIFVFFSRDISLVNLSGFNFNYLFLPFGVVLFAFLSFTALPEINFTLGKNKKYMKKVLVFGLFISIIFYILFAFVVVGFKGLQTPEIATLALGPVFIVLGILTMFTSYLALGNALRDHFLFDSNLNKTKSWFFSSVFPIFLFLLIVLSKYFSFTKILSIGGAVSGGLMVVLILLMVKKSKLKGNRNPEYSIPINLFLIIILILIFIAGVFREIWVFFK